MFMILELLLAALVCDPALAALFTPAHPQMGHYEVCTSPQPIADLVPAGARIDAVEAVDAFGKAGTYDRSKLALLYGGTRARIVRHFDREGGHFESVTLISPYPDASLTRLNPGTMVIRWIE